MLFLDKLHIFSVGYNDFIVFRLVSHFLVVLVMYALVQAKNYFPCVCSVVFTILHVTSYRYIF